MLKDSRNKPSGSDKRVITAWRVEKRTCLCCALLGAIMPKSTSAGNSKKPLKVTSRLTSSSRLMDLVSSCCRQVMQKEANSTDTAANANNSVKNSTIQNISRMPVANAKNSVNANSPR